MGNTASDCQKHSTNKYPYQYRESGVHRIFRQQVFQACKTGRLSDHHPARNILASAPNPHGQRSPQPRFGSSKVRSGNQLGQPTTCLRQGGKSGRRSVLKLGGPIHRATTAHFRWIAFAEALAQRPQSLSPPDFRQALFAQVAHQQTVVLIGLFLAGETATARSD